MAIQNFVSGGFYGKVGEFVGQRWKNIRTLRAYVIPRNPRTPKQQENRKFFKGAVPLAQLANSAYPHCPAFDTASNTQWAYRMSQAKTALENNEKDVNTVPIFPTGFDAPFNIVEVTVTEIVNTRQIVLVISGEIPQEERSYSALLYFADGSREGEMIVCSGKSSAASPNTILLECGDTLEIDTAQIFCRVFSNDDISVDTCVDCARIEMQKNLTRDFNIATDLEEFTINDDGTIDAIYKTPNAYGAGVTGTVAASLQVSSASRVFKAGNTDTSTTGLFSVNANFDNINGSVGVRVKFTPSAGQETLLGYIISGNVNIVYTNAATADTNPNSGSQSLVFSATWNNSQPNIALDFVQSNISVATNGTITATYKSSNVWGGQPSGTITAALNLSSCSRAHKNGSTDTSTSGVFALTQTVKNVGGFVGVEVVLTPSNLQANYKSFSISGNVQISFANVYTPETKPLTSSQNVAITSSWTNNQAVFALSGTYLRDVGGNDMYIQADYEEVIAEWNIDIRTNPTTDNDRAFQQAKIGQAWSNVFSMNEGDMSTWRLTTSDPTATETATFEATGFSADAIGSQTGATRLYPEIQPAVFENDDYTDETIPENFVNTATPNDIKITVKVNGFYTESTMPATADFTFSLSNLIKSCNWHN